MTFIFFCKDNVKLFNKCKINIFIYLMSYFVLFIQLNK